MRISMRKARWLGLVSGLILTAGVVPRTEAVSSSSPAPVLAYSTYLGDAKDEVALAIAADASGNTYVTGYTQLLDPVTPTDAFVVKLDPAGRPVYSVSLGGSEGDSGYGIAVDGAGNAYVTGNTYSRDFPRKSSLPPSPPGPPGAPYHADVFVAKLDPSGELIYSTVFGGSAGDDGEGIAVDDQGHAFVAGSTQSADFPVIDALQPSYHGSNDGFLAKLAPSGSALVFATYLGGSQSEGIASVALDPAGSIHVAGSTDSPDFPVANAAQATYRGGGEGFVAKLHPDGSSFVYSTYLGGREDDVLRAVAADHAGNTYVTGYTWSPDFPVVNAFQSLLREDDLDTFVTKLSPTGTIAYSTYLGGSWSETAQAIGVDSSGSACVVGETGSDDFPLRAPIQGDCLNDGGEPWHPCQSAFVAKLTPQGSDLVYSTYLGGNDLLNPSSGDREAAMGVAVDPAGNAYVTGVTPAPDFPVVNAFQPLFGGGREDAFVAKIVLSHAPSCATATASPARIWPASGKLVPVSIQGVTDPDGDPVEIEVTTIFQDEPLERAGSPDAAGVGTDAAQVRASREGGGDGRVYRIAFAARDLTRASCTGVVTVCVPHDQRPGAVCGDGGALVDSTRPAP